jgi:hypothetical protein
VKPAKRAAGVITPSARLANRKNLLATENTEITEKVGDLGAQMFFSVISVFSVAETGLKF